MAAPLDDDIESNNQDFYSLLNVRKEVRLASCLSVMSDVSGLFAVTSVLGFNEKAFCSPCALILQPNNASLSRHHRC